MISVALQTRVKATEWGIGKVLMSMQKHSVPPPPPPPPPAPPPLFIEDGEGWDFSKIIEQQVFHLEYLFLFWLFLILEIVIISV